MRPPQAARRSPRPSRELPAFEHNSTVAFKELDKFADDLQPVPRPVPAAQRQLGDWRQQTTTFAPPFNTLPDRAGAADEGREGRPAGYRQGARADRPGARKHQPGPAQLRSVPAVHRRIRARAAGAVRQRHRRQRGPRPPTPTTRGRAAQHYLRSMQVVTPQGLAVYNQRIGTDRGNPYFKPGAFSSLASGLPVFSNSTCANSAPAVTGPRQRDRHAGHHRTADRTARRQRAGNPQLGPRSALPAAEPVHVQRADQPVPARRLQREIGR